MFIAHLLSHNKVWDTQMIYLRKNICWNFTKIWALMYPYAPRSSITTWPVRLLHRTPFHLQQAVLSSSFPHEEKKSKIIHNALFKIKESLSLPPYTPNLGIALANTRPSLIHSKSKVNPKGIWKDPPIISNMKKKH